MVLAVRLQISSSSVRSLILSRNLFANKEKHRIHKVFAFLYVPACVLLFAYILYCLVPNNRFLSLRQGQVVFMSLYSAFVGILCVAFAYSLYQLQKSI